MKSPSFLPTITDNLKKRITATQEANIIVVQTASKTLKTKWHYEGRSMRMHIMGGSFKGKQKKNWSMEACIENLSWKVSKIKKVGT